MIIPDTNLLLYSVHAGMPEHVAARRWWDGVLSSTLTVGMPAVVIFGFLRISTNRRVFQVPLTVADALERVNGWLEQPNVRVFVPGSAHLQIAFRLIREVGAGGNLTTDAQIAAVAMEHSATVYSNDADFGRFPGLPWVNPLAS